MAQTPDTLTSEEMRGAEQRAIAAGDVTGLDLMERAGEGSVEAILGYWPALASGAHQAVVLCGPGGNGGDGFVVARLLKDMGWDVAVYAHGWDMIWRTGTARPDAPPDACANAERWAQMGGRLAALDAWDGAELCLSGHVVVVDALLGIGQTRDSSALLRPFWRAWDAMCDQSVDNSLHLVSLDVPTGYDSDSGALLSAMPFEPDLTVTFHAPKPVHDLDDCGDVAIVDIGL